MKIYPLIVLVFILQSCTKSVRKIESNEIVQFNSVSNKGNLFFFGLNNKIEIKNYSDISIKISDFEINGASYLSDFNILFDEINKITDPEQMGVPYKTFMYLMNNSYHTEPITGRLYLHHPLFFLNTIGSGFCDDIASVFSIIMNKMGFPCHVYFLNGHVVPEVLYNGKRMVFDVDLKCFYLNKQKKIASYADLVKDAELITNPEVRLSYADTLAYSELVKDIYTSTYDNTIEDVANRFDNAFSTFITLPKGTIQFFGSSENSLPALYNTTVPIISTATMFIETGFKGDLNVPLVISDIYGDGLIEVDGKKMSIELAKSFFMKNISELQFNRLSIIESRGIFIKMALNPKRFYLKNGENKFSVKLENVENATMKIK